MLRVDDHGGPYEILTSLIFNIHLLGLEFKGVREWRESVACWGFTETVVHIPQLGLLVFTNDRIIKTCQFPPSSYPSSFSISVFFFFNFLLS